MESLENRITFDASLPPIVFASVELRNDTSLSGYQIDGAGNTYRTGAYQGVVDFDPTVDRHDGSDILVNNLSTIDSGLTADSR